MSDKEQETGLGEEWCFLLTISVTLDFFNFLCLNFLICKSGMKKVPIS